ncbi:MAG: hypothetical protein AVDCRST_MAG33-2558, partial [uncultured Thermomicrobiales bacterium]
GANDESPNRDPGAAGDDRHARGAPGPDGGAHRRGTTSGDRLGRVPAVRHRSGDVVDQPRPGGQR